MLLRKNPKCHLCGGDINGVYKDQSDTPPTLRIIGDTFLKWDFEGHICQNKKLGKQLEFISVIKRDGSGVIAIPTQWNENSDYPKVDNMAYLDDDIFTISILSLTEKTYIASGFNSFVVKLKQ